MPYRDFPKWQEVVRNKHLLFDSDTIISLISFGAESLLDELSSQSASFNYINPVLLELMNTDSSTEKLKRNKILTDYEFVELPFTINEVRNAVRIQKSLPIGIKGKPSPTDFYIGGCLAKYVRNAYLLTSNVKDFPMPIFTREAFIPLINQTDFKGICVIGLDIAQLVEE